MQPADMTCACISPAPVLDLSAQGRLLLSNWWILLLGAAFQYVHGAFTAVAYHMHEPRETLKDLGFMLLPVRAAVPLVAHLQQCVVHRHRSICGGHA
jgi:hypothetical protein